MSPRGPRVFRPTMWARCPAFPMIVERWNFEMGCRQPGLLQWPPALPHNRQASRSLSAPAAVGLFRLLTFLARANFRGMWRYPGLGTEKAGDMKVGLVDMAVAPH
jgi:hypothetical protein